MPSFTTKFKDELLDLLEKKNNNICRNEEIEYSRGEYKIKFDGYIEKAKEIVIVEIEFRRADPINNLIKTIHWICSSIDNKKIKLIQIFDKNYYSIPNNRYKKDFVIFLAKRCKLVHKKLYKFFRYVPIDIKVDQKAFRRNVDASAKKLARLVCKQIVKVL